MEYRPTTSIVDRTISSGKEERASNLRKKSLVSLIYDLMFCAIGLKDDIQEKLTYFQCNIQK